MKIAYSHLVKHIKEMPSIEELSDKLFQLGHEHEINNMIFDMEFTPNRGDCLSINGLLRDLNVFYDIDIVQKAYEQKIEPLQLNFINKAKDDCKKISFLKIVIDHLPSTYNDTLESYFKDLGNKKINFFTDISNYISYETGQPTHCYDGDQFENSFTLEYVNNNHEFETLVDKNIKLSGKNLVFKNIHNHIINLAGVIGDKKSACNAKTKTVIIECAHFNPEAIIGKSVKYDIVSEASHKFERSTDPNCHDYVLRRFLQLVEKSTTIKDVKLYKDISGDIDQIKIPFNTSKINKILGDSMPDEKHVSYLTRLGFIIKNNIVLVPSYRNDIHSINDLAEEIARSKGYNNIAGKNFELSINPIKKNQNKESSLKKLLVDNGFYEVINNPFTSFVTKHSIKVDNPLDSNKNFLRTSLKQSLIDNLLYNERRQQDSVKLFEISNAYSNKSKQGKRLIGIIASGRIDKNYRDFSKKIKNGYVKNILNFYVPESNLNFIDITRPSIGSKLKNHISYVEFEINDSLTTNYQEIENKEINFDFKQYIPISEYPISSRDLSFAITNPSKLEILQNYLLKVEYDILKNIYIFDYYSDEKNQKIKIGFRFTFQSKTGTIKDSEVDKIINELINHSLQIDSVSIPGLKI
jgi:phenylalanyl-tRNA synthetase beta chain